MLNGETARSSAVRALDIALVLHADHELNASTFAARVTAATLSDMHSAITSAIGTLKGPLHGGANEGVLQMLMEIGSLEKVDDDVRARLARREKIMGFGHRVYTTEDPRATHLRAMSKEVAESSGETQWYDMSRRIEKIVNEEKTAERERGLLFRLALLHARAAAGPLHADLRGLPDLRLDGPRPRAIRQQPPDPSPRGVHRPPWPQPYVTDRQEVASATQPRRSLGATYAVILSAAKDLPTQRREQILRRFAPQDDRASRELTAES